VVSAEVIEPSGIRARPLAGPARQTIRVGCSGWQYALWSGDFYPAELPASRWFAHYALAFDTVEIDNSFYRLPPRRDVCDMARAGAAAFSLRRQRQPVPHAHEEAEGPPRTYRHTVRLRARIQERSGVKSQIPNPKSQESL